MKLDLKKIKYVFLFLGILLFTFYISRKWYQLVLIRGDSMSPSYHNMQIVLINRYSKEYTYGDVIAFQCDGLDSVLIKRVVACPGDEVRIIEGRLYVNGGESTVFSQESLFEYAGIADTPIQLAVDQYFVIGDNIEQSKDSRYQEVGCIDKDNIIGKVI